MRILFTRVPVRLGGHLDRGRGVLLLGACAVAIVVGVVCFAVLRQRTPPAQAPGDGSSSGVPAERKTRGPAELPARAAATAVTTAEQAVVRAPAPAAGAGADKDSAHLESLLRDNRQRMKVVTEELIVARGKVHAESPEVIALLAELSKTRKELETRLYGAPETTALIAQRTDASSRLQALEGRRRTIVTRAKTEDPKALMEEARALDGDIRREAEALKAMSAKIAATLKAKIAKDPEIAKINEDLQAKSAQVRAKVDESAAVAPLVTRQTEILKEARALTRQLNEHRSQMENAQAGTSPAASPE